MFRTHATSMLLLCAAAFARAQAVPPDSTAQQTATSQPTIVLTFDDLPAHGPLAPGEPRRAVVTSILASLKAAQMPPVYGFVNSFRMDQHPYQIEIVQQWHDAGQPLGNHSYAHEELDMESVPQFGRDLAANEAILRKVDPDGDWHWFRFPFLEEGDTVEKRNAVMDVLHQRGYKVAEVSMSFQDYRWNDAYGLCSHKHDKAGLQFLHDSYLAAADETITRTRARSQELFGRDIPYILLLHVGSFDAVMMPELIDLYKARGFRFGTLPEAAADPAFATKLDNVVIKGGGTFLELVATSRGMSTPPDSEIFAKVDAACK
jgi:peptidoglycan/xylan/chitin deacetylase (PgdA/CDA1 family)